MALFLVCPQNRKWGQILGALLTLTASVSNVALSTVDGMNGGSYSHKNLPKRADSRHDTRGAKRFGCSVFVPHDESLACCHRFLF